MSRATSVRRLGGWVGCCYCWSALCNVSQGCKWHDAGHALLRAMQTCLHVQSSAQVGAPSGRARCTGCSPPWGSSIVHLMREQSQQHLPPPRQRPKCPDAAFHLHLHATLPLPLRGWCACRVVRPQAVQGDSRARGVCTAADLMTTDAEGSPELAILLMFGATA